MEKHENDFSFILHLLITNPFNIVFFKEFVSEKKYDEILSKSDVIFSPIKPKKVGDAGIVEIYGKTEGSVLPFEAIQYSKPIIVPEDFTILKELESSTLKYKTVEDLEKILQDLIQNNEKIKDLKMKANNNSKKFS